VNRTFSLYLDLVRFVAAVLVFLSHSNQRWLAKEVLPASSYGHSAVVVFFVLSGFVIAYISDTRERDWVSYFASRLSRVLSVVVPAIVLTLVLDTAGRQLMPSIYDYPYDQFAARIAGSLLMLNELWLVSITYFSNVPYWSIGYEFWYYVAFGLLAFAPRRWRWPAFLAVFVVLGPKLLLLAPIWWAGVLLYRLRALQQIPFPLASILFVGSALLIVAFHAFDVTHRAALLFEGWVGKPLYTNLTFSKFFIGDYLLGALVFCNFAGARVVMKNWAFVPELLDKGIRWLASFTFSLYLLHQPLFLFWGALVQGNPIGWTFWWITTGLTAASIVLIAHFTENQRYLLKQWFENQLVSLRGVLGGRGAAT
jgi:peptidoglycan/LPS O-acetylase OafA/YrhL